ncbi:NnrU family protein [Aureimonas sp. AU4]|uniref:NnrU family protein n=1 Tax=Aureimonas sp. AU4 TaxID=1638163 RepID=UPI000785F4A3|nr:NnrU family protein [Aureimonas sp. AU4]
MLLLVLGLVLFLGIHSLRIAGDGPRAAIVARLGDGPYKGLYSVLSLAGLVLIGQGYGHALAASGMAWTPPTGLRHLALLLVPIAFVLVASAYAPAGRIKRLARHPMVLGVGLWALGHLLANGETANVVLFGAFLVWAAADYAGSLRRAPQPVAGPVSPKGDAIAVTVGLGLALAFILGLHQWLIGVSPLQ